MATTMLRSRLGRALGDDRFLDVLGDSSLKNFPTVFSDHSTLVIEIKDCMNIRRKERRKAKPFRYEHMWQRHEGYVDFINQAWDPGPRQGDLLSISESLSNLQSSLRTWDRDVFGSVRQKLRSLREELEKERNHTLYQGPTEQESDLMKELAETLAREGEMERQRSRADWLKSGDRNTGFFQAKAKARACKNRIRALK